MMAALRMVAVVVPSPAVSFVLLAACTPHHKDMNCGDVIGLSKAYYEPHLPT